MCRNYDPLVFFRIRSRLRLRYLCINYRWDLNTHIWVWNFTLCRYCAHTSGHCDRNMIRKPKFVLNITNTSNGLQELSIGRIKLCHRQIAVLNGKETEIYILLNYPWKPMPLEEYSRNVQSRTNVSGRSWNIFTPVNFLLQWWQYDGTCLI